MSPLSACSCHGRLNGFKLLSGLTPEPSPLLPPCSYQSGYKLLQTAKKANPSLLERFAIFSREQQHMQKSAGVGGVAGAETDLVSYVEFQRNYGYEGGRGRGGR